MRLATVEAQGENKIIALQREVDNLRSSLSSRLGERTGALHGDAIDDGFVPATTGNRSVEQHSNSGSGARSDSGSGDIRMQHGPQSTLGLLSHAMPGNRRGTDERTSAPSDAPPPPPGMPAPATPLASTALHWGATAATSNAEPSTGTVRASRRLEGRS